MIENIISTNFCHLKNCKLLLAVSGGLDSMVLANIFMKLNFDISIAHCNFQLRGLESIEDKSFVENFAKNNKIEIYVKTFDTKAFAQTEKLSIQLAARKLRYDWFYEILEKYNFDFILTAHHSDDSVETFFINLFRGTGLDGLLGIPEINNKIVRPFLSISKNEITDFATKNGVQWREDTSNASDKYLRNKIRHNLVPVLKDINPDFINSFLLTQKYLQQTQSFVNHKASDNYKTIAECRGDDIYFNIEKIKTTKHFQLLLFQWLKDFRFSAWNDIYNLIDGQTGKKVLSNSHQILKNRDFLILSPLKTLQEEEMFYINSIDSIITKPLHIFLKKVSKVEYHTKFSIFVDFNKLKFPLTLRRSKAGDFFYPFGMNGKKKKLSKFLKDEKCSLLEKLEIWLLCSDATIVWVVGMRQDERFKVTDNTTEIIEIKLNR